MPNDDETWPAGRTWVFQGTVLEDATAGTHVSSLTVTPGAGNELQFLYGTISVGNGAANLVTFQITDATPNILVRFADGTSLAANTKMHFPSVGSSGIAASGQTVSAGSLNYIVSGTMRLYMEVSTATVSLTHTFAVACRIKGAMPTATLADTVGAPTLTTNTNAVF